MSPALQQLASIKRSDSCSIDDVRALCTYFGLDCERPDRGSQLVVSHPGIEGLLTIPATRRIKPMYVMLLAQLAESVSELE